MAFITKTSMSRVVKTAKAVRDARFLKKYTPLRAKSIERRFNMKQKHRNSNIAPSVAQFASRAAYEQHVAGMASLEGLRGRYRDRSERPTAASTMRSRSLSPGRAPRPERTPSPRTVQHIAAVLGYDAEMEIDLEASEEAEFEVDMDIDSDDVSSIFSSPACSTSSPFTPMSSPSPAPYSPPAQEAIDYDIEMKDVFEVPGMDTIDPTPATTSTYSYQDIRGTKQSAVPTTPALPSTHLSSVPTTHQTYIESTTPEGSPIGPSFITTHLTITPPIPLQTASDCPKVASPVQSSQNVVQAAPVDYYARASDKDFIEAQSQAENTALPESDDTDLEEDAKDSLEVAVNTPLPELDDRDLVEAPRDDLEIAANAHLPVSDDRDLVEAPQDDLEVAANTPLPVSNDEDLLSEGDGSSLIGQHGAANMEETVEERSQEERIQALTIPQVIRQPESAQGEIISEAEHIPATMSQAAPQGENFPDNAATYSTTEEEDPIESTMQVEYAEAEPAQMEGVVASQEHGIPQGNVMGSTSQEEGAEDVPMDMSIDPSFYGVTVLESQAPQQNTDTASSAVSADITSHGDTEMAGQEHNNADDDDDSDVEFEDVIVVTAPNSSAPVSNHNAQPPTASASSGTVPSLFPGALTMTNPQPLVLNLSFYMNSPPAPDTFKRKRDVNTDFAHDSEDSLPKKYRAIEVMYGNQEEEEQDDEGPDGYNVEYGQALMGHLLREMLPTLAAEVMFPVTVFSEQAREEETELFEDWLSTLDIYEAGANLIEEVFEEEVEMSGEDLLDLIWTFYEERVFDELPSYNLKLSDDEREDLSERLEQALFDYMDEHPSNDEP
ncbi:hypothetical protein VM1G_04640 [Cytospora mali]|uniref:Uncharacterized protein n=1 Tax=Cytospora mali TaxID=578113 RepID=A0A194VW13_CYTMA|nr:hypothetical protein VM1G_04640 [Valsa mali]